MSGYIDDIPKNTVAHFITFILIESENIVLGVHKSIAEAFIKEYYVDVILAFSTQGEFLNELMQYEEFIKHDVKLIALWVGDYGLNSYTKFMNDLSNKLITKEPSKAIKSDIKKIKDFKTFINEKIDSKDILVQDFLNTLSILEDDLKEKSFKLFDKSNYYKLSYVTKQELKTILLTICKKYKLKGYTENINVLIDNIPSMGSIEKFTLMSAYQHFRKV